MLLLGSLLRQPSSSSLIAREVTLPFLTLIRGLPGSGKTTLARQLAKKTGALHFENDDYFYQSKDGSYDYNPEEIQQAVEYCMERVKEALETGHDVIVANTFTRVWELQPYLSLGYPGEIIVATGTYQNIHGVPPETIEKMRDRWEEFPPVADGT
jgi:adenylate kinase family enzyme